MSFFNPLIQLEALVTLALISIISLRLRILDRKGVLASIPIGYIIFTLGGVEYFIMLLLFFGLSSIATKIRVKKIGANFLEKDWVRSWRNVLANGLIPASIIISGYLTQVPCKSLVAIGYLAAVGTAFADTLATEIGLLYPKKPRLITNLKQVVKGTPGAISPYGYIGGILAGLIICAFSYGLGIADISALPTIIAASLIGMTIDSVLGATIQAKYRCVICGRITESRVHCGERADKVSGFEFVNTHIVNLMAIFAGSLISIALTIWI